MKIIYIANARIPTEKAHGYQICKMCEEFAKLGQIVELVIPERINQIEDDIFSFYGLEKCFKIKKIKIYDFLKLKNSGKIWFYFESLYFVFKLLRFDIDIEDIIYTRNPEIAYVFKFKGNKVVYEAHNWPNSKQWLHARFVKKVDKIIVITDALKEIYKRNSISCQKILVSPDGVDFAKFNIVLSKEDARNKLNLPLDKKIILYTGNLYKWKGVDALIGAGKLLEENCLIYIVGGSEPCFKAYTTKIEKHNDIKLVKTRPHKEIPVWLKAADVLVLPNSAKEKISKYYTSPLKMFEYMASKRPIAASNLPSICEILNVKNSVLVKPDSVENLADAIQKLLNNEALGNRISEQAFLDVQTYTWEKRAEAILSFCTGI